MVFYPRLFTSLLNCKYKNCPNYSDTLLQYVRLLLRCYPAAVNIIGDGNRMTPYTSALKNRDPAKLNLLRLLLRADPTMDLDKWHELNYDARRMGMFLSTRSICDRNNTIKIWKELWLKKD